MSFFGFMGGGLPADMDKPFYRSRMFIGGTIACVVLTGVDLYVRARMTPLPPCTGSLTMAVCAFLAADGQVLSCCQA